EAHFREARFDEPLSPVDGVSVRFLPAGHILGAAILEVTARDAGKTRKLVFSGDLGRRDMPIVPDPAVLREADYIVLET
ncbi:MAG: MBL fold metallo-hydrolase, partial [Microvirgula sp.]